MSALNETNEELIAIVVENKDQDENDILGLIIGKGVPFNKAKGILTKIQVSQGLAFSKEDRDTKAEEILASFSISEDTTGEEVEEQISNLMEELNCKVGMARNYVKAMFTGADIAYPKVTRVASGPRNTTPGFKGDVLIASMFALANPEAVENEAEVFKAFMDEHGSSTTKSGNDKSKNWLSGVVDLRIFGKKWADEHCPK